MEGEIIFSGRCVDRVYKVDLAGCLRSELLEIWLAMLAVNVNI